MIYYSKKFASFQFLLHGNKSRLRERATTKTKKSSILSILQPIVKKAKLNHGIIPIDLLYNYKSFILSVGTIRCSRLKNRFYSHLQPNKRKKAKKSKLVVLFC